ncbi:phosphate acyltransferase PlsX [Permianibacter sp. IMCC34836]|uniref:phosphate acyltransferase PlsX n=1 Tax=Permianibacter fluminis TaxID=2738515 RepID=UPI001555CC8D|nr:phosphate acyltransferase PlsX [Permianibacter fluminis]NQD38902.1 phosphate acyltransferase PlsX [Permianibacter fluminis]
MTQVTLAIDCMGGDYGPPVTIPAALTALDKHPDLQLVLVGDEAAIRALLRQRNAEQHPRLRIRHTTEVVLMDDKPSVALRSKKDSSLRVALQMVRDGEAQACVSAGNTGALMALARFVVKMLPGIDRPAICTKLPTMTGHCHMLDLGANIDCDAEALFQFAVMGSVVASAVDGLSSPSVGLLNVGEEEIKGNEQVKKAAQLLGNTPAIRYIGFVEGNGIYAGEADVIVCDGFVGNAVLKASEGIVKLVMAKLKDEFTHSWISKIRAAVAMPVLKSFRNRLNPDQYNGASLVGLDGIVIKSHGGANEAATVCAIEEAIKEVHYNVPQKIRSEIEALLVSRAVS